MDYWDAIEYILALPDMERFSSGPACHTMTLDAMKAILKDLKHPEKNRHTVHVTGSKGKGSTSTFIASILGSAGLSTALYTSPHLHDYTERIVLNGQPVSEEDFAAGINAVRDVIDNVNQSDLGPVSTFGAMNALFFHLCRQHQIQWQVVEVGLGGEHDGTNVFAKKDVAVITPISLEHTAILGNTCAKIAQDKAGIITEGCTVVLSKQNDPLVKDVVVERCRQKNAKLIDVSERYTVHPLTHNAQGQSFKVAGPHGEHTLHMQMLGIHQMQNAATALAVAEALIENGAKIRPLAIHEGIANAEIAGRAEQITGKPIVLLDGAHNGESAKALVETIQRHFDYDRCFLILGANTDKQMKQICQILSELEPVTVFATASESQKAMRPARVAEDATQVGLNTIMCKTVDEAIRLARKEAGPEDLICVTGSLYLVGEVRERILAAQVSP
jgi:dihydrofolate synthase / folylpolyglutamate synthase